MKDFEHKSACCYVDSMQGKQDLHVAKNFTPGVTGVKCAKSRHNKKSNIAGNQCHGIDVSMDKLHRDGSYRDVFSSTDALQCSTPLHLLYGCTMYVLEALLGVIVALQPATVLHRTIFGALTHRPTPIPRLSK
jgi:hypothetical protein